jgi:collagenase-like PrtC family protease
MLSAATLERVSASYRKGYHAGYAGEPNAYSELKVPAMMLPFGEFDYTTGYEAGANDRRWADTYAAERKARFNAQCG